MTENAYAIFTLCSHLCVGDGVIPFEPKEWTQLALILRSKNFVPSDLFHISKADMQNQLGLTAETVVRIARLIDRSASLTFEMQRYENMGISVVTRADRAYPQKLKEKLKNSCPPLFYYAGDLSLLKQKYIGYVGSRNVSDDDSSFTKSTVIKTVGHSYGVVSGGAKGVDSIAGEEALASGAYVIEYLSDSLMRKIKRHEVVQGIQRGRLLLMSVVNPSAGFNVSTAMLRNRFIYAQSEATIVVRSDYNKGGTWAGATENLRKGWCKELCREKPEYRGNSELINMGAIPINEKWDGDIDSSENVSFASVLEQLSLFDDQG